MITQRVQTAARRGRAGFVILSVFIILMLVMLVVTGVVYLAQAEAAARHRSAARTQQHALGWSAAQVLMHELNAQRAVILDGQTPRLDDQYELYDLDGRLGIMRLLPLAGGARLQPEAARLDINEIDAETLAATNVVDSALAGGIIEHRDSNYGGVFSSLAELCSVPGVEPRLVFGLPATFAVIDQAKQSRQQLDADARELASGDSPQALADVLTVYGFEPAIQRSEKQRINLNVPWSEELGRRIDERFGEGASQILKQLFERIEFDEESKVIETMIRFDTELEDWPDILDALTTEAGPLHFGRVDINTASREVLAALPGIEPEHAAQIVQMRDDIDAEQRASIVWPALNDVLPRDACVVLAGRITTRSWTYRLRAAVGDVSADDPDGPISEPLVYELVIDLSAPQPRLAMLRDITLIQSATMIASDATRRGLGIEPEAVDVDNGSTPAEHEPDEPGDPSAADETRRWQRETARPQPSTSSAASADDAPAQPTRRRPGRWNSGD